MPKSRSLGIGLATAMTAMAALALPAGAGAATTIGSNLATAPGGSAINCAPISGCTFVNSGISPGTMASGGLTAPIDGVVVRWRIRTGGTTSLTAPRIIRPGGVGAGTGTAVTPAINTTATFDSRLPITAGDYFGINQAGTSFNRASVTGSSYSYWFSPALAEGGAPRAYSATSPNTELLVNADIEPDVDGDDWGDETQDLCPEQSYTHGPCQRSLYIVEEPGVTVTGPGIDCPGDCGEVYVNGTAVDLTAHPDKGYEVTAKTWGAPCVVSTPGVCSLVMTSDVGLSALLKDVRPPQTTITKAPRKRSHKRKVRIKFTVDKHVAEYQCALDTKKFTECHEPFRTRVSVGKHVFMVRGVRPGGIEDPTPAKVKFRVLP